MPLNSRYKSIIELILLLGLAILMAIALSVGIPILLGGSSHPTVAVTTGSMLPIYNGFQDYDNIYSEIYPFRGDILLVKKIPIEEIDVGDVIVFDTPSVSDPVVHRVIAKWEYNNTLYFKTNGDNNEPIDSWQVLGDAEIIHGVVVLRIPHIGWFLLAIQTTLGKVIVLALAVLILFFGDDSEEDTPNNEKKLEDTHQQKISNRLVKFFEIGQKVTQKKNYFYVALTLMIFILFLGSNLFYSFLSPPSIKLYHIRDESRIANLIVSPSPLVSTDSNNQWKDQTNQTTFFFPVQIEIQSGGIFNNIDRIEIRVNETKGLYCWNTVYNFVGTRVFKGAIIAVMNSSSIVSASVSISLYSRGLFASTPQFMNFTISLRS